MPKRVLIAGLFHETHTFLDGTTGLRDFAVLRGEEMLRCAGDSSPLGGALESAREFGWDVVPAADFRAAPGAIVEDAVVETFWTELAARVAQGDADIPVCARDADMQRVASHQNAHRNSGAHQNLELARSHHCGDRFQLAQ